MNCVKCNGQLTQMRAGNVSIDKCGGCGGMWFDPAELEGVLEHVRAGDFAATGSEGEAGATDHVVGTCPRCNLSLEQTEALSGEGFFYDRCASCGGAWLDAGELQKVASDADTSAEMAFFTKRRGS